MKLKNKLRLALELGLVTSALPLLLLGCGGGGGSSGTGAMTGQFWTDLTGTGIRQFWPGQAETASWVSFPAMAQIDTATYSAGSYSMTSIAKTISGVAWTNYPYASYYLTSSGWTLVSSTSNFTAPNATTIHYADTGYGSYTQTVSTVNLSGTAIVASSMVPAVDSLGNASSVSPASATYPPNSYAYQTSDTATNTTPAYWIYAESSYDVTTAASSVKPINIANFSAAGFKSHASTADPICVGGYGLVWQADIPSTTSATYAFYALTLNGGVHPRTYPTCQNSSITISGVVGTYDLSFMPVMGTTVVTFSNPTGLWFPTHDDYSHYIIGVLPSLDKAYWGEIVPAGTSTTTSYYLNKTAMDAALQQAWGMATTP